MNNEIKPSKILGMTLPLFDLLTFQGVQSAQTITKIISNLTVLKVSLESAEAKADAEIKEAGHHDADDGQGKDV